MTDGSECDMEIWRPEVEHVTRYDRHVVGITWHDVWSYKAKIYVIIRIKSNQLVYEIVHTISSLTIKRI